MVAAHLSLLKGLKLPDPISVTKASSIKEQRQIKEHNRKVSLVWNLLKDMKQNGFDGGKYRRAANQLREFDLWHA